MNYKPTIVNINSLSSSKRPNYHYVWETQTLLTLECWLGLLSNPFNFKDGLELIISLLKPISPNPFLLLQLPTPFPGNAQRLRSIEIIIDLSLSTTSSFCLLSPYGHNVISSLHLRQLRLHLPSLVEDDPPLRRLICSVSDLDPHSCRHDTGYSPKIASPCEIGIRTCETQVLKNGSMQVSSTDTGMVPIWRKTNRLRLKRLEYF